MKRLLNSRPVDQALRGAALVVTDRRWAAPLSAAALGFGVFAGVAIGPGTAGSLATSARQIIEIPSSGGDGGQSGGGDSGIASTAAPSPALGGESGGFEEALPSMAPLAPAPVESLPPPASEPAAKSTPPPKPGKEENEEEETQELKGTVVHANPAAGSYAIAIEGGELVSVHAPELPQPGTKLSAPMRRLANGTFAEAGEVEEERKRATKVAFRGIVTFVDTDPAAPAYTVSGRGSSLLVRVEPDPSGAAPELPEIGSYVTVTARIDEGLQQKEIEVEPGPPSTYLDLAGVVREIPPGTGQLLFSVDWAGENEANLTLTMPKDVDTSKLEVGDSYLATATVEGDGSLALSGITSDEHANGADDPASAQGDLKRQAGPSSYAFSGSGSFVSLIPKRS